MWPRSVRFARRSTRSGRPTYSPEMWVLLKDAVETGMSVQFLAQERGLDPGGDLEKLLMPARKMRFLKSISRVDADAGSSSQSK